MKFGDVVVIQGAGGLGIYAAAVAAEKDASKVTSIDGQKHRLAFARQCGATDVIDMNELPTQEARVARVKDLTDGSVNLGCGLFDLKDLADAGHTVTSAR